MSLESNAAPSQANHLADNMVYFGRLLRGAGLRVGSGQILDAVEACQVVGLKRRDDFYWCLHAVFVRRSADRAIFNQAFHLFWRNPRFLERMQAFMLPEMVDPNEPSPEPIQRRLNDALSPPARELGQADQAPEIEIDASMTWSAREALAHKDFEQMSADELREAKLAIANLRLPLAAVKTRRFAPHPRGERVDIRATMRASGRAGADLIDLRRKRRRTRPPVLVVICDISGSMTRYSRVLLHFAHVLTNARDRVHSFVFGTRLTNISRLLREKDVDKALERVSEMVEDWHGGTRMGECLREFNRHWSRRVLAQGAIVLLISDGLDRAAGDGLGEQAERLRKSAKRLIWLNPLLRYADFEPRAAGMRALLPHVDDLRAVHNVESLRDLCEVLSETDPRDRRDLPMHRFARRDSDASLRAT